MASITCYGGAGEVTGSCHLVASETLGNVLLDCGMHQGGDAVKRIRDETFSFDVGAIDAVILSHAHLDHSGMLPRLAAEGFEGPVYCTQATADLLPIMLYDAAFIYERDLERSNKRRQERGKSPIPPAYSKADVRAIIDQCVTVPYRQKKLIHGHCWIRFHDAGHILGSAIVELELSDAGTPKTVVFSGDLGKESTVLMNDPSILRNADLVLLESTYGDRNHRSYDKTIEQLESILKDTWRRGGNVMIPAFAVGRSQELIYHLGKLHHQNKLDPWRIFLDSPMAIEVTKVYDRWIRQLDPSDIRQLEQHHSPSLKEFLPGLTCSVTADESIAINDIGQGALIIAGSGMCTGGRIRHHFRRGLSRRENTVVFIGFQANGTLGRILVDGHREIKLFGEELRVNAQIETLGGFSAHAGQNELVKWAGHFGHEAQLLLVHGEPSALTTLQKKLFETHQQVAKIPVKGERIQF